MDPSPNSSKKVGEHSHSLLTQEVKKKAVKKRFFTAQEKEKIKDLREQGLPVKQIAETFGTSPRHIRDILKSTKKEYQNQFTEEEDRLLMSYYQSGFTKEWKLQKFFPNKLPYMIRNRIRTLKHRNILGDPQNTTPITPIEKSPNHIIQSSEPVYIPPPISVYNPPPIITVIPNREDFITL